MENISTFTKQELIDGILGVYPHHPREFLEKTSPKHLRLILADEIRAKAERDRFPAQEKARQKGLITLMVGTLRS